MEAATTVAASVFWLRAFEAARTWWIPEATVAAAAASAATEIAAGTTEVSAAVPATAAAVEPVPVF